MKKAHLPLIRDNTFHDESDSFEVIQNLYLPHFILYFAKNSQVGGKSALYKYDESQSTFQLITLKPSRDIANISKVVPAGKKMFCLYTWGNHAFYINEMLEVEHEQKLFPGYEYFPNPDYPDFIAERPVNTSSKEYHMAFSVNYGEHYTTYFMMFKKFDWVPQSKDVIFTSTGKKLTITNMDNHETSLKLTDVEDYMIAENQILIIQSTQNVKQLNLSIYDAEKRKLSSTHFPALLKIHQVKLFDYVFGNHYLVLVDDNSNTCLWSPTDTPLYFVRKACYRTDANIKTEPDFYISKIVEGVLYWNHLNEKNELQTYRSSNNGRSWFDVKFELPDKSTYNKTFYFDFKLRERHVVPTDHFWIDIQFAKINDAFRTCITQNNGYSWTHLPMDASNVIFLNSGTVIVSVVPEYRIVIYSLDGAKTWINHRIYGTDIHLEYVGKFVGDDLKALVVARDSRTNKLYFKILDFSNIFTSACKSEEYLQWPLHRSHGFCYQGTILLIKTRDPTNIKQLRLNARVQEMILTGQPFSKRSRFNYFSLDDLCVLDPNSDKTEEPYKCDSGSHFSSSHAGYVKIPYDKCNPSELNPDAIDTLNDLCVPNEYTDFLVLKAPNKIYVSQLPSHGGYFRKQIKTELFPNKKEHVELPIAFDYTKQLIYNFHNKYLRKYSYVKREKTDLYYLEDAWIDIVYDSVLHVMIFLTTRMQLKIVSLLTNYQHLVSNNVKSFRYESYHAFISFVMSSNAICYSNLFDPPICIKSTLNIIQTYIDFYNKRVYMLSENHDLIIKKFENDITNLQDFSEIPKVSLFVVYDDHLYFVTENQLSYRNLAKNNRTMVLIKDVQFTALSLHHESLQSFKHECENLNCQFMCFPASVSEVKCGCPPNSVQIDNICECPKDNIGCLCFYFVKLASHCAGFPCKNSKCLINNVQCNGVDDCGDGSDEIGCKHKCPKDKHMCGRNCITKDIVCNSIHISEVHIGHKGRKLIGFYIFLIFMTCLTILYPLFLFIRWCYRRLYWRYIRLRLRRHAYGIELSRLLEEENELYPSFT
ncbi:Low-density lipoprotein receptor-related protein 5 [Thelohanellus kitauei]|uniref:Low-density lipoprotein receptor-related protein 5 n=1 Tax=Thelohanellus kitauei TaxID=669202 RepID=A0A0C2MEV8_THEKT|nr:Low-density lipoprotein receptor-related protein 5 [Thelohanellus kitauei]